jgi:hypothetical protein
LRHDAKVTVMVPHYAMSGGMMIALVANEILLAPSAVLGPVDPQIGQYPAASILAAVERKDVNKIDDETLIHADMSRKAVNQVREAVTALLTGRGMDLEAAQKLASTLSEGGWTHDYPSTDEIAKDIGLPVSTDLPNEVRQIIRLYHSSVAGARRWSTSLSHTVGLTAGPTVGPPEHPLHRPRGAPQQPHAFSSPSAHCAVPIPGGEANVDGEGCMPIPATR